MTREELIAALEKAEYSSEKLDKQIGEFMGWRYERRDVTGHWRWVRINTNPVEARGALPEYTSSIDAALTLVPEGWSRSIGEMMGLPEKIRWMAHIRDHRPESVDSAGRSIKWKEGEAPTPAIAICIAALKARADG